MSHTAALLDPLALLVQRLVMRTRGFNLLPCCAAHVWGRSDGAGSDAEFDENEYNSDSDTGGPHMQLYFAGLHRYA